MKNSLKEFSRKHRVIATISSITASVFMVAGIVAATSIGDSISVTTTLGVTGTSTLAGLTGSYITSTGNLNVTGNSRVGTVDSGTWQGTAVTVTYGGTGAATFTANRVLYGNGTGAILAANGLIMDGGAGSTTIASNLTVTGIHATGTLRVSGVTTLETALTVANGGTGAATLSSGDMLLGNGTGVIQSTSTLAVNKGGTGQSTYTVGDVLYSNVTNNLAKLGIGTAGQVLMVSGGVPTWAATSSINGTVNSGTTNRVAFYTSAQAVNSANGFIIDADNGSTTIASNLTVTGIHATGTLRVSGAVTLETALTVANGGTGVVTLTDIVLGNGTSAFTATSTLTASKGGTGVASFTANGVLYGNDTGNILVTAQGPDNSILTANAGAPVFTATPTMASTSVLGSLNTGTLTATSGTSYLNALSLATDLTVANGGTGASTFTTNAVLVGNGTGAITTAATSSVGTATSTPSQEFNVTGDKFVANSGTTTLFMDSTTAENGACIQMKSTQGPVRMYITIDGTTPSLKFELGSCK